MTTTARPPDTKAARRPDLDSLYSINADGSRNKIHPADVRGRFQRRKNLVWTVLFAIYVVLPWIRVNGHPAVLLDIVEREFWLFGASFNAQDFYLAFFLVAGVGFALFVVSALWGRVWCGYACPHTVFLEGFYRRIERLVEGNAVQRRRLQEMPWSAVKLRKRLTKWTLYLAFSAFLSHSFLSYFMGAEVVLAAVTGPPSDHPAAFTFVLVGTALIYGNFAWFREQMCIIICPYGRMQSALYDRDTINVVYDHVRGEPRGKLTSTKPIGDCIDCYRCVQVCPTGIDIRNGTQMECVGCANCVDACDDVMDRIGRPRGLIRYDSQNGVEGEPRRLLRPRVVAYAVLLLAGALAFAFAARQRAPFEAHVTRQQGDPWSVVDGRVRNPLLLHLVNKQPEALVFEVSGEPGPGVGFLLPFAEVPLEPFGDRRIPFFVDHELGTWRPGATFGLSIRARGTDLARRVEAEILGPRPEETSR